jgi:two-component system, chemotaxis family, chemotaxis protein CheY
MSKRVVMIGHCGPDGSYLKMAVSAAERGTQVVAVDDEARLEELIKGGADLLLFNRILDYGFPEEEGVEVIRRLRAQHPNLKMMLVSNYAEAQAAAVKAGALPGFGKKDLGSSKVAQLLRDALAGEPVKAHVER